MPRKPRRARLRDPNRLTSHAREVLLHGIDLFRRAPAPGELVDLDDPDAVREAGRRVAERTHADFPLGIQQMWERHRSELMSDSSLPPGTRPWGWWTFDFKTTAPAHWYEEIASLLDRNLILSDEIILIEKMRRELAPGATLAPLSPGIASFGAVVLREMEREYALCARWHAWRNRPDLAAAYQRRADQVRDALALLAEPRAVDDAVERLLRGVL